MSENREGEKYARHIQPLEEEAKEKEQELQNLREQNEALMGLVGRVGEKADTQHIRAEKLAGEVGRDKLTGLLNRRGFQEAYEKLVKTLPEKGDRRSAQEKFTILIIDVNNLKPINDTYGHGAGDAVLLAVADHLRSQVRSGDIIERHGGDEFVMLFARAGARDIQEKLMSAALRVNATDNEGKPIMLEVNMSGGITSFVPGKDSLEEALVVADRTLYLAKSEKEEGKNKIFVAEER